MSILLEVRLSSLVLSTYMEEEGASAIMRWGRHLGVKCAERERERESVCDMHLCARMFLNARCTGVDKNWEYQVYKEHRPQFSTL